MCLVGCLVLAAGQAAAQPSKSIRWVNATEVLIRKGPGLQYRMAGSVSRGDAVFLKSASKNWCEVTTKDGATGYIFREFLTSTKPEEARPIGGPRVIAKGWIAGTDVNARKGPGTEHQVVARVAKGTPVKVLFTMREWNRVKFGNGKEAWVAAWLVKTAPTRTGRPGARGGVAAGGSSSFGQKVVAIARGFMGTPYHFGGSSGTGFDCSGFVYHVMRLAGRGLPHDSRSQFDRGTPVPRGALRLGDVVFFCNTYRAGISHVGIYVGGNQFIHASSAAGRVQIDSLSKPYYDARYAGARRMG